MQSKAWQAAQAAVTTALEARTLQALLHTARSLQGNSTGGTHTAGSVAHSKESAGQQQNAKYPFSLIAAFTATVMVVHEKLDIVCQMTSLVPLMHPPHLHPSTPSALCDVQQWQQLTGR